MTKAIETLELGKCIKQLALNAAKNAKFHSNLAETGQFIAKIVIRKEDQEDFNHSEKKTKKILI